MDSPPIRSRFYSTGSESDSDAEKVSQLQEKTPLQRFQECLDDSDPTVKKTKSLQKRIGAYMGDEPMSPVFKEFIENCASVGFTNHQVMNEYLETVKTAVDTPTRKLRSLKLQAATDLFSRKLSQASQDTAQYHREAYENFLSLSKQIHHLKAIPCEHPHQGLTAFPQVINMVHIVEGEPQGNPEKGLHTCMHNAVQVQVTARQPATGVFAGTFGPNKFSTFFPDTFHTEDQLVQLLQTAEKVAQKDNTFLYRTTMGGVPFYIEKLFQEKGCVVQSAYPIFYFARIEDPDPFVITDTCQLVMWDILDCLPFDAKLIKYELGEDVIVDIAPLFVDRTGIPQGIYIQIPLFLLN